MKKAFALLLIFLFTQAVATIPVIDYTEVVKTAEMISKLDKQYHTLQSQYQTMQEQYHSLSGHYGWGGFQNSLNDLKSDREWAPSNWQKALKGESGGNPARYQQLLKQYKANHQTLNSSAFAKGSSKQQAASYTQQVANNQASATQAQYTFNNIDQHLQDLYQLSQQIGSSTNQGVKSAIDLNSRIELEIAYISVAELRMQALLNQQDASLQAKRIAAETEASEFNQAGE